MAFLAEKLPKQRDHNSKEDSLWESLVYGTREPTYFFLSLLPLLPDRRKTRWLLSAARRAGAGKLEGLRTGCLALCSKRQRAYLGESSGASHRPAADQDFRHGRVKRAARVSRPASSTYA